MIPTIVVLRVDGHGEESLTLHTTRAQAEARLVEVGRKLWRARFDYDLPEEPAPWKGRTEAAYVSDRLVREGWRVRLDEEPVEL